MTTSEELADNNAAPLDALLVDAAMGPLRRLTPDRATLRFAAAVLRRRTTAQRLGGLAGELARIVRGRSDIELNPRDRRFADVAWTENPLLHRLAQAYLAAGVVAGELVDDADLAWADDQRVRFLVENLVEAFSPSNLPVVNPASAKAIVDSAGLSLVRGTRALVRDVSSTPRIPQMVDPAAFDVGTDLAVTPGTVVLRTELLELIRYTPTTELVSQTPLLVVPPTINKFYVLDLAPGRSLAEYLVGQGQQVFMMSWRNPDARHAKWDLTTYVDAVIDALDSVRELTGVSRPALMGVCSGGIIASIAAAYLAKVDSPDRLAALVLMVCVLDNARAGTTSAFLQQSVAEQATARSRKAGYLDGKSLAEVFAWLRPSDLIWNYWVNNYLLGKKPPAFDILYWNSDTTRMTAGLHADFVDLALHNRLVHSGETLIHDVPIDLGMVTTDAYVVAGTADHITPWQSCYRTTQLLGGQTRFVLSTSGHIAALVNPPTNRKARFQTNPSNPPEPQEWVEQAQAHEGSWWTDLVEWLAPRCGPTVAADLAPAPDLAAAPGTYVFEN